MNQQLLCLYFTCFSLFASAQTHKNTDEKGGSSTEIMPKYQGTISKIMEDSMVYPEAAIRDRVGGRVVTEFTVDTFGNTVNIKVVQGVREDIDREAVRLVGLLKDWSPGVQDGRKVKVIFRVPMIFSPDNRWKRQFHKHAKNKK